MKATEILMQEHRLIERVLDALEAAAGHVAQHHAVRPGFFLDAADFIAGFADGCHHHKEEDVLFGALGGPETEGAVVMMLFPMADELLSAEEQSQLIRGIERIEREEVAAGAPERFRALAERFEEEVNGGMT